MKKQMTSEALEIRERMIAEAVVKYGAEAVERWAANDTLRSIINALAQIEADDRQAARSSQ